MPSTWRCWRTAIPETVRRLLTTVYQTHGGRRATAAADHALPDPDAATAIRLIGGAGHTGKVVLDVPHTGCSVAVMPPEQAQVFRPDGAYIVTGGLGGLGLFLAGEMAAAGCGRIVLNSRSAAQCPSAGGHRAYACRRRRHRVECGDIAETGIADRLVAVATATGLPVRGVLHAAGVVEDATLVQHHR